MLSLPNYIDRNAYLDKILPFIDKNLIKFITGQRRVGKSYLLYQVMGLLIKEDSNANIIHIDKEKYDFDKIKSYEDIIEYCNPLIFKDKRNYIFIDEVQEIHQFEKALRHYYSFPNIDIYCTGSNARLLSGELATFLSGRYIEFKVYSLSYTEFLQFHKLEDSDKSLLEYMKIGGLPYLVNLMKSDKVIYDYLGNILSTIIYKDIVARHSIRNTYFLENLVKFLATNTGNIISAKKISDYLKSQKVNMSPQIVLDYLNYLEKAFLIFKVKRSDITGKKVFEVNEKYYFEDWGLRNAILGIENFSVNQIIENIIYLHLKINHYEVYIGSMGNHEIDFVGEKKGKKLYVQAAYLLPDEKVREREFGNLQKIKDNYRKIVVSMDPYAPSNVDGIEHFQLREFLVQLPNF
jgi:uncharacterized protein